jgi:hypothetical protein
MSDLPISQKHFLTAGSLSVVCHKFSVEISDISANFSKAEKIFPEQNKTFSVWIQTIDMIQTAYLEV